jgi:predicted NUDIX family NTP pyrophosphohydrolase
MQKKNKKHIEKEKREFKEETGFEVDGEFIDLGELNQSRYKIVHVWALERDLDVTNVVSNRFTLEWPKNSGKVQEYPEVDRAEWFDLELAKEKLRKEQIGFIYRLLDIINNSQKEEHSDKVKRYRQTTLF